MSRARDFADLAGSADAGGLTGRNIVINGNMAVVQRGTSSTASGIGCVDRFTHAYSGGTVTSSQGNLSSSDDPYSLGLRNYIRMTNTANTTAANAQRQIYQNIEAQYLAKSGWNYTSSSSYVTLSFWIRSSLAGKYGFYLLTYDGTAQQFSFTETLVANTWKKVTKTIPGNSNLTFNDDTGLGLSLVVFASLGSDYTDSTATMDAWIANDNTKLFQEDLADWDGTTNATLDVTAVQFEVGATATPFEHEGYGITLIKSQRYYYQTIDTLRYMSQGPVTAQAWEWIDLPVTMRAQPTALVYGSASEGNVGTASQDGGDQETLTLYQSPSVLGLLCATSTSGQNLHFYKIKVDAEI